MFDFLPLVLFAGHFLVLNFSLFRHYHGNLRIQILSCDSKINVGVEVLTRFRRWVEGPILIFSIASSGLKAPNAIQKQT